MFKRRTILCIVGYACLAIVRATATTAQEQNPHKPLRLSSDFSGGSATVLSIDQQSRMIRIRPESNPDRGWECWWYFKLEGCQPGEKITFEVNYNGFALPDRAHFSDDNRTWKQ